MVNTPVLYITFARPEYASRSFAAIKKAQPKKLYFYSNKARMDRPDEIKRNSEVRSFIKQIDWDCDLVTWFREDYVDVFTSLWGAIDWVFNNEEEAIILEEDCVASLAFFDFCDKLLPRYKNESRVRLISGDNFTPEYNPDNFDYFFSRRKHIYGWASWRNRWVTLERDIKGSPRISKREMKVFFPHFLDRVFHQLSFGRLRKNESNQNPWDVVTSYNMVKNNEVTIIPRYNLVKDIGYEGANHAVVLEKTCLPDFKGEIYPVDSYPEEISPFDSYDYPHFKKHILGFLIKYEVKKYSQKLFKPFIR